MTSIEGENTGKTVAFFYINSNGNAVTRKSSDYVSKMIEAAGGSNVFTSLGDAGSAMGSTTLEIVTGLKNAVMKLEEGWQCHGRKLVVGVFFGGDSTGNIFIAY